jgi:SNF2 family DNA or RNA helicase
VPFAGVLARGANAWRRQWGYFDVGMYVGPKKERQPVLDEFKLGRLDIGTPRAGSSNSPAHRAAVLTSFETALRDIDLLDALPWTVVIIDECHRMKNPRAKTTEAFARLAHPRCRVGLTGTAIQNSYEELWTILDWTNPGRVGSQGDWEAVRELKSDK